MSRGQFESSIKLLEACVLQIILAAFSHEGNWPCVQSTTCKFVKYTIILLSWTRSRYYNQSNLYSVVTQRNAGRRTDSVKIVNYCVFLRVLVWFVDLLFYPNCCKNNRYQKNHFLRFILQCTLTNFIHWSRLAQLSRWYALDMRSLSLENWEKVTIIQTTTQQTRFQGRAVLALFGGLLVHFRYWSGDIQHS